MIPEAGSGRGAACAVGVLQQSNAVTHERWQELGCNRGELSRCKVPRCEMREAEAGVGLPEKRYLGFASPLKELIRL